MRIITGTMKSTPVPCLPVLSNVAPPCLRRYKCQVQEYNKYALNRNLPKHNYANNNPNQTLKSRKLPWKLAQKLTNENINLNTERAEEWKLNNLDKSMIIEQPTERNRDSNTP